ncbi:MAG TPA: 30S ribosomal protein S9 [Candidatus Saccharimonadales bacterium]|nr:30S ribosomal protein S9 [Candidatus Saccharimonadales bacterium]
MADKYFYGLGRRKAATASARLFGGKGTITINDKPVEEYLAHNEAALYELLTPLRLIGKENDFDATFRVKGGGTASQIDACRLAMSKALASMNDDLNTTLRKNDLLKRDSREKERKKYGLRGARKREQFSKR